MKILLASASPRRKELLYCLLDDFEVVATKTNEDYLGDTPSDTVIEIATGKAMAVPDKSKYDVIIASDTLVVFDGKYIGKPIDKEDAFNTLKSLSGKTHEVCTSVVIIYKDKIVKDSCTSYVTFKNADDKMISDYIDSHNVLDKAGAYAIQDEIMVDSYKGSYSNIVGLPIQLVSKIFDELGIPHKVCKEQ